MGAELADDSAGLDAAALAPGPPLLVIGPAPLARAVRHSLKGFVAAPVMTRRDSFAAMRLLAGRPEIGVVLLLWQEGEFDALVSLAQSILWSRGCRFKTLLVRCATGLPADVAGALWDLGVADLAFAQPVPSMELTNALAVALRDDTRNRSLVSVSAVPGRFSAARTLREIAELTLQVIHENGIGRHGGLFCFRSSEREDRIVILAGTGRYRSGDSLPLEALPDHGVAAAVRQALLERDSVCSGNSMAVYIGTADGYEACIHLSLKTPLTSWKRGFVEVLAGTVATSIDQVQMAHRLLQTQHATIIALATLAEYRDVDTGEHVARVARMTTEIAVALAVRGDVAEIDDAFVSQIGLASILHDIGKIAISESVLQKPGPLTAEERHAMQAHTVVGQEILLRAARRSDNGELLRRAAEIALHHHEKYDGGGYPAGLCGDEIPLAARIVALVDVFDALTSARPYKLAWPVERALDFIRSESGRHFDPVVVDVFMHMEATRQAAKIIEWKPSMSVGNSDLDDDHQRLIGIINRLWLASRHGNRRVVEFILDDLVTYTEFHFRREEQLMAAHGHEGLTRHRQIHHGFCRRIEELRWEYFQGIRAEPQGEMLEFLTGWLNRHILEEDMACRRFFGGQVGDNPARSA